MILVILNSVLTFVALLLGVAVGVQSVQINKQRKRVEALNMLAEKACNYAEQLGGSGQDKLVHAIACFHTLDRGHQFTSKEARLAIEAHLGRP